MFKVYTILFTLIAVLSSCEERDCCAQLSDPIEVNDPYELKGVEVVDHFLEIEVSYAGGCKEHEFAIEWPDVITMVYPPDFGVTLYHDSNGDTCEALITDTLRFDINESGLGLSQQAIDDMRITVVNGSNPEQTVSNK
ncbi:MAG: hypothetical protein R3345_05370 [Fulvivirga sp.]|nr:hypothetical protein [Fulvivirga sp.]